jgi:hypothetical protein
MAASPRIVTEDITITWDNAPQRLAKGQILDVPPGSALEEAIGTHRLAPMLRPDSTAAVPETPAAAPPTAPAARKKASADGDGGKDAVP